MSKININYLWNSNNLKDWVTALDYYFDLVKPSNMEKLSEIIGKRNKEIRESKNIKQVQLAEMVDMEPTNLSKLEKGIHLPKKEKLQLRL